MRQTFPRRLSILLAAALMAALALPCFAAAAPSAPASAADAGFVASLTAAPAAPAAPALTPAPTFLQATGSGCTSNAQCPAGQLCCRACGYFGCTQTACFAPMNGHCPLFP